MTNFPDRETQRPGYDYTSSVPGNSPMWIIGIVVVVLIFGSLLFNFGGPAGTHSPADQGSIQHMTQPAPPTTSPATPSPTPKP